jgi:Leucine-rich repeat (LRR) protein
LTSLEDINAIKNFKNLKELYIENNNIIDNLELLSNLKNLEYIQLCDCNTLQSIKPLFALNKIKTILINHCYGFTDLHLLGEIITKNGIGVCYKNEFGENMDIEYLGMD